MYFEAKSDVLNAFKDSHVKYVRIRIETADQAIWSLQHTTVVLAVANTLFFIKWPSGHLPEPLVLHLVGYTVSETTPCDGDQILLNLQNNGCIPK